MGYIYVTTNLINGKQYIGWHNGNNNNYLGSGTILSNAIKKYGRENFLKKIIIECTQEMSTKMETKYIKLYNTIRPHGYNVSPTGGFMKPGGKHDELTKNKIGVAAKKRWEFIDKKEYGKKQSTLLKNYYKNITVSFQKDHYISKYGISEGTKKWKEVYKNRSKASSKAQKGKKKIDIFINKYGKEEGIKRYNIFIEKMSISKKNNKKI